MSGGAETTPGLFVAFEGVDGAGKSSQLRVVAAALRETGRRVVETREPGGAPGAEEIRALLVRGETERWSAETELLLFTAARRDHMEKTVWPALVDGAVVLCDRFIDSTRVYQAAGRGANAETIERLHALMIGCEPNLTLIFDISPELARARAEGEATAAREDRYERFGVDFQQRLRAGFLALAQADPAHRRVIDASRDFGVVQAEIRLLIDTASRAQERA